MAEPKRQAAQPARSNERVDITGKSVAKMGGVLGIVVALQSVWIIPLVKTTARDEANGVWDRRFPAVKNEVHEAMDEAADKMVTRREFDQARRDQLSRHKDIMKALEKLESEVKNK